MNSLFPLFYSIILFFFLFFISFYVIKQINDIQRIEKTIFKLQEIIKKNNTLYEVNYKLGKLYLKKKLYKKAILLFKQALKTWDTNDKIGLGNLYNMLGFTYFTLNQYKLAIYYYSIALKFIPTSSLLLLNLGYAYEKLTYISEAYNTYKSILILEPENQIASTRIVLVEKKLKYLL
uniref:hypothetical protein n=1 Tax=Sporochnus bolleanus TaxID=461143 RepID=UPI002E7A1296|nr:hypothetical protein V2496_pgp020 [Sporochnus bolleanus]WAM64928.1 hypothetical protein [Sporochnus bolleanus]